DRHDVEAHGLASPGASPQEEVACRLHDSAALARSDALERRGQRGPRTGPDLDDDERVGVAADEVELAELAAVVAHQDRKAVPLEVASGHILPALAATNGHSSPLAEAREVLVRQGKLGRGRGATVERYG